jgi:hypothetical protein
MPQAGIVVARKIEESMEAQPSEFEVIASDLLKTASGSVVSLDEYAHWSARQHMPSAVHFDGGSPHSFPRLGLSEVQRQRFLEDVIKARAAYISEQPDDWRNDWILDAELMAADQDKA